MTVHAMTRSATMRAFNLADFVRAYDIARKALEAK